MSSHLQKKDRISFFITEIEPYHYTLINIEYIFLFFIFSHPFPFDSFSDDFQQMAALTTTKNMFGRVKHQFITPEKMSPGKSRKTIDKFSML
jgi:hypothetical protein